MSPPITTSSLLRYVLSDTVINDVVIVLDETFQQPHSMLIFLVVWSPPQRYPKAPDTEIIWLKMDGKTVISKFKNPHKGQITKAVMLQDNKSFVTLAKDGTLKTFTLQDDGTIVSKSQTQLTSSIESPKLTKIGEWEAWDFDICNNCVVAASGNGWEFIDNQNNKYFITQHTDIVNHVQFVIRDKNAMVLSAGEDGMLNFNSVQDIESNKDNTLITSIKLNGISVSVIDVSDFSVTIVFTSGGDLQILRTSTTTDFFENEDQSSIQVLATIKKTNFLEHSIWSTIIENKNNITTADDIAPMIRPMAAFLLKNNSLLTAFAYNEYIVFFETNMQNIIGAITINTNFEGSVTVLKLHESNKIYITCGTDKGELETFVINN